LVEDAELKALDEDPCQTQEKLVESCIASCSINHFHAFKSIENDSKGNWVLYELKPRELKRRFFTCE